MTRRRPGAAPPAPAALTRRRAALALSAVLAALLLPLPTAGTAGAATGYRYWSYWTHDAQGWTYATEGPATARPADGDVQGFRFAVSEDSADADRPRGAAAFGPICAGTPAQDGMKRVALVIDFGTAADAPSGESPPAPRTACARVREDASAAEALAAEAKPLRYDANALLCAIAGYPAKGCGEQVSVGKPQESRKPEGSPTAQSEAAGQDSDTGGTLLGLLAGVGAVVLVAAATLWQVRRRRDA